jgi:outer membrane murein-binding lipoprotein Lpp
MRTTTLIGFAAAFATQVFAACQSATKIDDFSKWSSNTNNLGEYTSGTFILSERLILLG